MFLSKPCKKPVSRIQACERGLGEACDLCCGVCESGEMGERHLRELVTGILVAGC